MSVEGTVKRIGGSTFVLLPPDVVKALNLKPEDRVLLDLKPLGGRARDVMALKGKHPDMPDLDRSTLWGE